MQTRKFDEMISYFNRKVSDMYIDRKYKIELFAMIAAIGMVHEKELDAQQEQWWIPCSERLPEKYGNYLVTTDDGEVDIGSCDPENKDRQDHFWSGCDADGFFWYGENIVIAWMPLPKHYMRGEQDE